MRVVATAGHVDHGKSSLVLALTGTDPDRFAEEKRRGLTIDLGFAHAARRRRGDQLRRRARPRAVPAQHARRRRRRRRLPVRRRRHRGLEAAERGAPAHPRAASASATASSPSPRSTCSTTPTSSSWPRSRSPTTSPARSSPARRSCPSPRRPASGSTTWPRALERAGRARRRRRATAAGPGCGSTASFVVQGQRHGRHRHADRRVARRPASTSSSSPAAGAARVRGDPDARARSSTAIGPGHRVALNLAGVEHTDAGARRRRRARPGTGGRRERVDASLTVLASLDHVVSRRGAYLAYIGSGEHAVRLRVLGPESLPPGRDRRSCGSTCPVALPLLPGDRYVLRETGRDETVGGGEVLDVAPVLPGVAGPARPRRRPGRRRAGLGRRRRARAAHRRAARADGRPLGRRPPTSSRARRSTSPSGSTRPAPLGLDVCRRSTSAQRAVLATLDDVVVDGVSARRAGARRSARRPPGRRRAGRRRAGAAEPRRRRPRRAARAGPPRRARRARRAVVPRRRRRRPPAGSPPSCCAEQPAGFTVGEFREAAGITRKHAVPLLAELDARGVTRRRGDLRIAGNRLPPLIGARDRRARGQADSRRRRRSSWFSPPQMP